MKKIQMTKEGHDTLSKELDQLKKTQRPLTLDKLQKARSMGDLKENNAYQSAREELGEIDGRIQEIEYILGNSEIIASSSGFETVGLGNTVTVLIDGAEKTLSIVGEFESDPMNGKISATSPIGAALIGAKVGMTVSISSPAGQKSYKVLAIK